MEKVFINKSIGHRRQQRTNDCGVACLLIALDYAFDNNFDENRLIDVIFELNLDGKSLWTIDIAHISAILNLRHEMFTVTFGVLENYSTTNFYVRNCDFEIEKERINHKFLDFKKLGISIEKSSVSLDFIKQKISLPSMCVCICLVDTNKLRGINTNNYEIDENLLPIDKIHSSGDYCGHFIVVIGYNTEKKLIYYRNPASDKQISITTESYFEEARKAFGTDEDILFIYANKSL